MDNENTQNENMQNEPAQDKGSVKKALKSAFDYFEMCAIALVAALILFSFFFRICTVDGNSMNQSFSDKQIVLTSDLFYSPNQGDVIVFHPTNDAYEKPLIKRIIALEGQNVTIDVTAGVVYIDGEVLEEDYAYFKNNVYNSTDVYNQGYFNAQYLSVDEDGHTVFSVTVPENCLFVMGDNRNGSTDSRSAGIGFVNESSIIGKVFLRISPFTLY